MARPKNDPIKTNQLQIDRMKLTNKRQQEKPEQEKLEQENTELEIEAQERAMRVRERAKQGRGQTERNREQVRKIARKQMNAEKHQPFKYIEHVVDNDLKQDEKKEQARKDTEAMIREAKMRRSLKKAAQVKQAREDLEAKNRAAREQAAQAFMDPMEHISGHRRRIFEGRGIWHYEAFKTIHTGSEQTIDVPEAYRVRDSCEPADVEGLTETHI
jgi:hypothetical protein